MAMYREASEMQHAIASAEGIGLQFGQSIFGEKDLDWTGKEPSITYAGCREGDGNV